MRRRSFLQASAGVASLQYSSRAQSVESGTGFAERDISPVIGMEQPGGYGKSYHRSFHDPCKARAAVFGDGSNRVALVGVDAGAVSSELVEKCRDEISRRCGIAASAILIGASHSHSGGPVGGIQPGEYDSAPELVRRLAYEHSTVDDPGYVERVHKGIVDAVCAADEGRAPLLCGVGSGLEEGVSFNRRFRMRNGQSWTHPGQGNPDILKPAGPIDPAVGVIGAWHRDGRMAGCVVNFCCHATTNPGGISANWVYYMEQAIRGAFGHHVIVIFLQGAAGDVTQVNNLSPSRPPTGDAQARLVGGCVGAEAVRVLLSMHRGTLTPVAALNRSIRIDRRAPSKDKVRRSMDVVQRDPKQVGITTWTFAKETVLLDAKLAKSAAVDVEVQAMQVGPAVFLANPAELFCEFGLEMRRASRFPFTFPVSYANGSVGYVPTEEAFGPGGGGYETRLTSYSNLVPPAGRRITDACLDLASRLAPGVVPEPPLAPAFDDSGRGTGPQPWSYGNIPPELS